MGNKIKNHNESIEASVGSLYARYLKAREEKRLEEKQMEEAEEAEKKKEENQIVEDDEVNLSRKEKQQRAYESWKDVVVNLTGDDLEYSKPKKKKKKYRAWLDENMDLNNPTIDVEKPKKRKKKNYKKEFEHELTMLKNIVSEQNKFTNDLNRRFTMMVGPNTKDSGPLSKTAVELAATIVASRSNSLAIIREIGNLKKTIAQLTQKEREIEAKRSGEGFDTQDLGLMGSSLAMNIFGSSSDTPSGRPVEPAPEFTVGTPSPVGVAPAASAAAPTSISVDEFDPSSWDPGPSITVDPYTKYESRSTKTVVEYDRANEKYRYKTIDLSSGEEIPDYPNPTFEIRSIDLNNRVARDSFDSIYELEIV